MNDTPTFPDDLPSDEDDSLEAEIIRDSVMRGIFGPSRDELPPPATKEEGPLHDRLRAAGRRALDKCRADSAAKEATH